MSWEIVELIEDELVKSSKQINKASADENDLNYAFWAGYEAALNLIYAQVDWEVYDREDECDE